MKEIIENSIEWDEPLWRYFKVDRFIELIEKSSIYFAVATQFDDIYEGAVAIQSPQYAIDSRYKEMEGVECAFRELKRLTKICCWHRTDYESAAMWRLYAESKKGVALCTTAKKIGNAIQPFRLKPSFGEETLFAGNIEYVDLTKERLKEAGVKRFYYKHLPFSWEQEFRLSISLEKAEEFGENIQDCGIDVSVNLNKLIDRIVLGPNLTENEKKRIYKAAELHDIDSKIEMSTLVYNARFI